MTTIDVSNYSATWVLRAMVAMRRDGEVQIVANGKSYTCRYDENTSNMGNELALVRAATELKRGEK